MTVVGFSFTKMIVEKNEYSQGKINIANNVAIKDVTSTDLSLGTSKHEGIKFQFTFRTTYEPDIGKIEFEGNVLFMAEKPKVKDIIDGWKKDKKVPKDTMTVVLNTVLQKANLEALFLSREVNLPPPIPLPKVNVDTPVAGPAKTK